ncbi:MAG: hypothetical protein WBP47_03360 [Candidatus Promineifilaceae bacterium]
MNRAGAPGRPGAGHRPQDRRVFGRTDSPHQSQPETVYKSCPNMGGALRCPGASGRSVGAVGEPRVAGKRQFCWLPNQSVSL